MSFRVILKPGGKLLFPYQCGWCGLPFRSARELTAHVRDRREEDDQCRSTAKD